MADDAYVSCSFCGKDQREVRKLISGSEVYICDECIRLANNIIADEARQDGIPADPLPRPSRGRDVAEENRPRAACPELLDLWALERKAPDVRVEDVAPTKDGFIARVAEGKLARGLELVVGHVLGVWKVLRREVGSDGHVVLTLASRFAAEATSRRRRSAAAADGYISCSFCGKDQRELRKLIAGPKVYICDECLGLCNDIIAEEIRGEQADESGLESARAELLDLWGFRGGPPDARAQRVASTDRDFTVRIVEGKLANEVELVTDMLVVYEVLRREVGSDGRVLLTLAWWRVTDTRG